MTANIEQVVRGKHTVVELAVTCLAAEGHLLIEDVPGVGKTLLARCLAASIDGRLQRVQFTPDLLPSDITGVTVYEQASGRFRFHPGPVFGNVVHGDEINRASPKTQSALLEVMEERRVTVDGQRYEVPRPFMVIATQNPIDMDGTYPLPEAQLDRFLMRVHVGYPDERDEISVLAGDRRGPGAEHLPSVTDAQEVAAIAAGANEIHLTPAVYEYIVRVTGATRRAPGVRLGASPRAGIALLRAARARAAVAGRGYVVPEDVRELAQPVLAHRLILTPDAESAGKTPASVLTDVLAAVPVPQPRAES
ncbi:MAG: AAA family ATPase [Catenulispora sp.]|nr:AAA family ATPase [Catenulispora sp.]